MIGAHWPTLLAGITDDQSAQPVEPRIERALAAAGAVAWEWDISTGESSLSAGAESLLGLKDDPADAFLNVIHPADRDWLKRSIRQAARGDLDYDFEFRLLRPDGLVEWVRDRGQLERDGQGRPVRLAGVAQLITVHKRKDDMFEATFEQAAVAMAQVALDGAYMRVNDCLCSLLDRPRDQLLRLRFQDVTHPEDLPDAAKHAEDLVAGRISSYLTEQRYLRPSGEVVWGKLSASLVSDPAGKPDYFVAIVNDINDRKRAELAYQGSEARLRALAAGMAQAIWHAGPAGDRMSEDRGWAALTGQTAEQKTGWGWLDAIHPDDRAGTEAAWRTALRLRTPFAIEHRVRQRDDGYAMMLARAVPMLDPDGSAREWIGSHSYAEGAAAIEAFISAQDTLAELQAIYDTAPIGLCVLDTAGRWTRINQRLAEINGLPPERHLGRSVREVLPDLADAAEALHRRVMQTGEPVRGVEISGTTPAQPAVVRTWLEDWLPLRDARGQVIGVNIVAHEVTDERAVAEQRRRLLELIEHSQDLIALADASGRITYMNRAGRRMVGQHETGELGALSLEDLAAPISRERLGNVALGAARDEGSWEGDLQFANPRTGRLTHVHPSIFALRDPGGELAAYAMVARDITGAKAAMAAVAEHGERWQRLAEALPQLVWACRPDGACYFLSRQWVAFTGVEPEKHYGFGWVEMIHPDDRRPLLENWREAVAGKSDFSTEARVRGADGGYRWFKKRAVCVRDEDGTILQWFGTSTDITDTVEAREVLRRDRLHLEELIERRTEALREARERLSQAEKLAALGELAGGIAHDFNNVLQALQGGASLIRRRIGDPSIERLLDLMEDATRRGMSVTARLLTFARRSERSHEPTLASPILTSVCELLSHTLGSGVEIRLSAGPGSHQVFVDRSQFETVLVNLATNARDAMPGGGVLTIELEAETVETMAAARVGRAVLATPQPGRYLRVDVSDTGVGMSEETLSRVTEPFFTTKPPGQGTGLGLAMAKGFAEEIGGGLVIESEKGHGTMVSLWLPLADAPEPAEAPAAPVEPAPPARRRVLFIDRDASPRHATAVHLADAGYDIVPADTGLTAISLLESGERLDVVVSDPSLPDLDGTALMRAVARCRPGLPVILVAEDGAGLAEWPNGHSAGILRRPTFAPPLAEQIADVLRGLR